MAKKPGKNITKARASIEARPYKLPEAAEAIKNQKADAYLAVGPGGSKITIDAITASKGRKP